MPFIFRGVGIDYRAALSARRSVRLLIEQHLTQQDIANMVGCAREMVAQVMKTLTESGYVEIKGKRITIK